MSVEPIVRLERAHQTQRVLLASLATVVLTVKSQVCVMLITLLNLDAVVCVSALVGNDCCSADVKRHYYLAHSTS